MKSDMQQRQRYSAKFIVVDGQGNCTIYPPQDGGQQQVTKFCIGYIRAVVPKSGGSDASTTVNLLYTGHPCHRAYVILVPTQQTGQTVVTVKDKTPVVDIIACFEKKQNKWEYEPELPPFDVMFDGISLSWAQNVEPDKQKCDKKLKDLIRQLISQDVDEIEKKLPSSIAIYYVK
jgi:hypothetical protein